MTKCWVLGAAGMARQLLEEISPTPGAGLVNDDDAQRVLRRPFDQRRLISAAGRASTHREPFSRKGGQAPE
jgi:hypothetical protein